MHYNHSGIDHTNAGITSDILISLEQYRTLLKEKETTLLDHSMSFDLDTNNPVVETIDDTSDGYGKNFHGKGWITDETFIPHMQKTVPKVTMENGKVLSDTGLFLPCFLEEFGCETTSLDPFVYFCDYPDNCTNLVFRTEEVNMLK